MKQSQPRREARFGELPCIVFATSTQNTHCHIIPQSYRKNNAYINMRVCVHTHLHAPPCIHFMSQMPASLPFPSRRNHHTCLHRSTDLPRAWISPRALQRRQEGTCCPAGVCVTTGAVSLGTGHACCPEQREALLAPVRHRRAALSACVRVTMSQSKLSQEVWSKLLNVAPVSQGT